MTDFFKTLGSMFAGKQEPEKKVAEVSETKVLAAPAEETEVKEVIRKVPALVSNDKEDFQLLLGLYKKHKSSDNIDFAIFVKQVNPDATPHKCPYCGVVHDFTAVRARKCPACSEKMVVRQGLFLTEDQVAQLEKVMQTHYNTQSLAFRLGSLLESAQEYKVHKQRGDYLLSLAEAFRYAAQIEDQRDSGGYSFWDRAWSYYNKARLGEMKETSQDMLQYSKLPSIFWDMSQMILDQAKLETTPERESKGRRQALTQAFMSLAEAAKFGADPWFRTSTYELIKDQIEVLGIALDELKSINGAAAKQMRLEGKTLRKYEEWLRELDEYEVIAQRHV